MQSDTPHAPHTESRVEFTVDNDPRLMAGVTTIVSFAAHASGMPPGEQDALAAAVVEACKETFPLLNGNERSLKVIVDHFHDRVEIAIEHSGERLPTAGLDTFCAGAPSGSSGLSTALLNTHVDRVKYETQDGRSRTIMVKYRPGATPQLP